MAAISRLAFLGVLTWLAAAGGTLAKKQGGILRQHIPDNPASLSIHEESTVTGERPAMPVFNNLVVFDQHVAQNSMASIVPDLAEKWSWGEDGTKLTFQLHQGVKWHDGKPFTSADVKCTWDLLQGKGIEKLNCFVWLRSGPSRSPLLPLPLLLAARPPAACQKRWEPRRRPMRSSEPGQITSVPDLGASSVGNSGVCAAEFCKWLPRLTLPVPGQNWFPFAIRDKGVADRHHACGTDGRL